MINGQLTSILIAIIGFLLGLVQILFGLILKAHKDRDDERIAEMQAEIVRVKNKLELLQRHPSRDKGDNS